MTIYNYIRKLNTEDSIFKLLKVKRETEDDTDNMWIRKRDKIAAHNM